MKIVWPARGANGGSRNVSAREQMFVAERLLPVN